MKATDYGVHDALIPEKFESEVDLQPQMYNARVNIVSKRMFFVGMAALALCGVVVIVVLSQKSKADG